MQADPVRQDSPTGDLDDAMPLDHPAYEDEPRLHSPAVRTISTSQLADDAGVWIGSRTLHEPGDDGPDNDVQDETEEGASEGADSDEDEDVANDDDGFAPWLLGLQAADILEGEFEAEVAARGTSHQIFVSSHPAQFMQAGCNLSPDDMSSIRAHNYKVSTNLGAKAYEKLPRAFPELSHLPSLQRLRSRITFLSGIKHVNYDCCKQSCCCFTGPYAELTTCPFCTEPRFDASGHPRNVFSYIPLIPRLVNSYNDPQMKAQRMYRSEFQSEPGVMRDVFDSEHYKHLCQTYVTIGGDQLPYRFFSQPSDIALGISTDGFGPFKRRKQTCWPLIGIDYNLPPEIRVQHGNIIDFGVIPGPKQPKDFDSFLLPLVEELIQLIKGVPVFDESTMEVFLLRLFLILIFGDMPAIAKLMRMKGVGGIFPCRSCEIMGIRDLGNTRSTAHYTPLHRDGGASYDPLALPLRTHEEFIRQATHVARSPSNTVEIQRSKDCGINGVPLLSTLSSISIPASFPHDFMHLIFENVVPTMVEHWTGNFKGLDKGCEDYVVQPKVWDAIGDACGLSGRTIPFAFGRKVPNIAKEKYAFTAESWLLFATQLSPILLRQRFNKNLYYKHFVQLVNLINLCLRFEYSDADLDTIRTGFANWVKEYER